MRSGSLSAGHRRTIVLIAALAVVVVGILERLSLAHQTPFADELSTYWISSSHSPSAIWSLLGHQYAGASPEISPPLYFLLTWLPLQIGHSGELLRLPSLIAGVLTIPVVFLLGRRTVGETAAWVAAALATFSPFMLYFSAEARPYAVMMLLVALTTLTLLCALDTGRNRWFVLYALTSCAAMYAHYTAAFVLVGQLLWVLWRRREAWRPVLLANAGATVLYLPWVSAFRSQQSSTTTSLLSDLSPFTPHDVVRSLTHWVVGDPVKALPDTLQALPGVLALVLLGVAVVVSVVALVAPRTQQARAERHSLGWMVVARKLDLLLILALSTLIGEAIVSAVSTHMLTARNLAASSPALLLCLAALLVAPRHPVWFVTAALGVACFAIGAVKMADPLFQRPDFQSIARYIDTKAGSHDPVIDESVFYSPGPLSPLDAVLHRPHPIYRVGFTERSLPFAPQDRNRSLPEATREVLAQRPPKIFVAAILIFPFDERAAKAFERRRLGGVPPGYHVTKQVVYPGLSGTALFTYERNRL